MSYGEVGHIRLILAKFSEDDKEVVQWNIFRTGFMTADDYPGWADDQFNDFEQEYIWEDSRIEDLKPGFYEVVAKLNYEHEISHSPDGDEHDFWMELDEKDFDIRKCTSDEVAYFDDKYIADLKKDKAVDIKVFDEIPEDHPLRSPKEVKLK